MMSSFNAHCTKGSSSGGESDKTTIETRKNVTDWWRIFPVMPAWMSFCVHRNGRCDDRWAAGCIVEKLWFSIAIWRESGLDEARLSTVLLRSQNWRIIPSSSTFILSRLKMLYKLHGAEPRPANVERAGVNHCTLPNEITTLARSISFWHMTMNIAQCRGQLLTGGCCWVSLWGQREIGAHHYRQEKRVVSGGEVRNRKKNWTCMENEEWFMLALSWTIACNVNNPCDYPVF